MISILLNLDPQIWLDTLESLTFQLQNHKKPLKMSKLAFLEKFAKKLFHVKLFRKAWGKIKRFHIIYLKIIMWKLFSIKTDFTEFLLVKTQIFGQIWELSFEIWWISGLQSEQKSKNFNFEQVDFLSSVYWIRGSVGPCIF